jgi:hypothetical protein
LTDVDDFGDLPEPPGAAAKFAVSTDDDLQVDIPDLQVIPSG